MTSRFTRHRPLFGFRPLELVAEVALGLPLRGGSVRQDVVLREGIGWMALKTEGVALVLSHVVAVPGHLRGSLLRGHGEEDKNCGAHGQENDGLPMFFHGQSSTLFAVD